MLIRISRQFLYHLDYRFRSVGMSEDFSLQAFNQRSFQAKEKLNILREHVANMQKEFSE